MANKSEIESKWEEIFSCMELLKLIENNGFVDVEAPDLKKYFEPRLLCKMDFREKVPPVFKRNNLSILAISNGKYRIAPTDPFFDINLKALQKIKLETKSLPDDLETIDPSNITNESQALDAAAASGMLSSVVGQDLVLTIRGRRRSGNFSINLPSVNEPSICIPYDVNGVQIEVDGGYEGKTKLILIEAKASVSKSMNIRQLIYPQIHFEESVSKSVETLVLFYDKKNQEFNFIPIKIGGAVAEPIYAEVRRFKLESIKTKAAFPVKIIDLILPPNTQLTDQDAPFPQANDLQKVLDAYQVLIERSPLSKAEVFEDLPVSVVGRQYDYYINVLRWLRLVEIENGIVNLSSRGQELGKLDLKFRIEAIKRIFHSDPLVREMLKMEPHQFSKQLLSMYDISGSTPARRQSTIKRWQKYFEEYLV